METSVETDTLRKIGKLTPKAAQKLLETMEVNYGDIRFAVDFYYQQQKFRIAADAQQRAEVEREGASPLSAWIGEQEGIMEASIKNFLGAWAARQVPGAWALRQYGIGPVITAGMLAHIDIAKAPTVGHIWRFAGLDPTVKWNKGEKRPWNARLKVLCWKAGESFKKFSNREECFYGKLYRLRKAYEVDRNEKGGNYAAAAQTLVARKIRDKDTIAVYEAGKLPPGRLDLRAMRWAVKIFLAHLHEVMYIDRFGTMPPKPYVIEHLGHAHQIVRPE